jgi:hypothetical protein
VHGSLAYRMDAKVLNMSLTGMAMETGAMLKVGANYRLQVAFESEVLDLPADVKWCHLVRTETSSLGDVAPVYQAGIDFRSILDEKARQVLSFIEKHIIVDLDQRLFGRFKINGEEAIELAESREFVVRRLSLSGMLIETGFSPQPEEVLDFEFYLHDEVIGLRGRVANVNQVRSGQDFLAEVGVEFSGLDESQRRLLVSFIEGLLE